MIMATQERGGVGAVELLVKTMIEPLGIKPNEAQWPILLDNRRFIQVSGGERSGKSLTGALRLYTRMFLPRKKAGGRLYWLVGANYGLTKPEFGYLGKWIRQVYGGIAEVTGSLGVDPGYIKVHFGKVPEEDIMIETKQAGDPMGLSGYSPDGVLVCEAAQMGMEAYWKLQGRVVEGGWLMLTGTMEGSLGWFPSLIKEWSWGKEGCQSYILPTESNLAVFPGGHEDKELVRVREGMTPERYRERFEGVPCPPGGMVMKEFSPVVHIDRGIEWEEGKAVHLWVDPGFGRESAYAVEAVQIVEGEVRVIDEVYLRGLVTAEVIDEVFSGKHRWGKDVKFLVIDPSYVNQHHAMTSVGEEWQAKAGMTALGEKVGVMDGIERFKTFLRVDPLTKRPRMVISPRCHGLLSELGAELDPLDKELRVWKWKTDRQGNVVGEEPEDRNNHAIKAIIYGLVENFGHGRSEKRRIGWNVFLPGGLASAWGDTGGLTSERSGSRL